MTTSTSLRLAAFVAGLAAVFGLAFGVGRAAGPIDRTPGPQHVEHGTKHGSAGDRR